MEFFLTNKSSFWRISGLFGKSQVFRGWAKKSTFRGVSEKVDFLEGAPKSRLLGCAKKSTFWVSGVVRE